MIKFKNYITVLLSFILMLGLFACGNDDTGNVDSEMSSAEKLVFDALVIALNDFNNPSKVRVLEAGKIFEIPADGINGLGIVLRLQGENKLGGTLNKEYFLILRLFRFGEIGSSDIKFYEHGTIVEVDDFDVNFEPFEQTADVEINIGNINHAIREHYDELGIG